MHGTVAPRQVCGRKVTHPGPDRLVGPSGAGMRLVVDATQAAPVYMAVQLRGREGAVAEEVLDRAQVGAALQEMSCERMTQAVRMREHPPQRRRVEATATRREEQRVLRAGGEPRARVMEVLGDELAGLLTERNDPFLAALAVHMQLLAVEVHIGEIESDRLRTA